MSTAPHWQIPTPIRPYRSIRLVWGDGTILRATYRRGAWHLHFRGAYSTLNDINKIMGFPPDDGPDADLCALPVRSWPDARVMR